MKKTILTTALMTLLCHSSLAEDTATQPAVPDTVPTVSAPIANEPAKVETTTEPLKTSDVPATPSAPVIDCKYAIPAQKSDIEASVISTWGEKAAMQSFSFNPASVDQEMGDLKLCYTDQGWQGFTDALQKSGNIDAIKTQHLTVSSQMDGEIKMTVVKDNQWKVIVPLQVVYQNDKEKLTQQLTVELLIGRKVSGDLGIMQMIASPRPQQGDSAAKPASENMQTLPEPAAPTSQETTPAKTE
jgi:hypothetical protein